MMKLAESEGREDEVKVLKAGLLATAIRSEGEGHKQQLVNYLTNLRVHGASPAATFWLDGRCNSKKKIGTIE